ncbi:hypothetical protein [Microseira wollei]|uniref:Uncharacterized protein n=1 Tax=Microseira wollei NIES-4236 TaxID=2530354 RepID=A0AAV3XCI8_9CYAN|nr:hypothetical protein [Microseira wollei]GET37795.1 hypothetical protein MiSe_25490 [Microseira wollei NIES-4236]
MPEYVFGDSQINYLVPNDKENTAINQEGVTFKDVAASLVKIYKIHLENYPDENFWGQPEELVKIIDEDGMNYLLNNELPNIKNNWLIDQQKNPFAGAVKIRQSVLNIGDYVCHMIKLIEVVSGQKMWEINCGQRVYNIDINNQGFYLKIASSNSLNFAPVIAGYARGLEIPIPSIKDKQQKEGNLVKLKIYGLYKIPPALKLQMPSLEESFSSTILIRGQYGGIIKVGYGFIAIFSGTHYNQAEFEFPLDEVPKNIPTEWWQNVDSIMGRTEKEVLASIKYDISRWIPWVKELEDVKLKTAVQVYPGRKPANDLEAAQRDENPVRYMYQHKNGGKYIHIPGFKLTSIPYNAFQVVLEILSIYIVKGILTQEQVDRHIRLDKNSQIILSREMECVLGKDLPQAEISEREKIVEEWNIY